MSETQSPPPVQPPTIPPPSSGPGPDHQARMWNMLCHLSGLAGWILPFAGNILGPFVVWQIKKNEIPSVDVHGKAALNFQITATIVLLAGSFAAFLAHFICLGWLAVPLVTLLGLGALVCTVIAGVKANNGEDYQYPFSFEFVK